jgi:hypothetical protein
MVADKPTKRRAFAPMGNDTGIEFCERHFAQDFSGTRIK